MSVFAKEDVFLPRPKFEYITTEVRALEVLEALSSYDTIEIDTETTGLDVFTSKIVLLQMGVAGRAYVFDVRSYTTYNNINPQVFKSILTNKSILKILQNASFDMKMIKYHWGFYIENIYDTMIAEQLLKLGITQRGASLEALVRKYLGIQMDKQPVKSFEEYNQEYKDYQLVYAANDVVILNIIMQIMELKKHGLEHVAKLEFDFVRAMCEMELNGITIDVTRWRELMVDAEEERQEYENTLHDIFSTKSEQTTLFGVSTININSNQQLKKELQKFGFNLERTDVGELEKHEGHPVIDALLGYRKTQKFISTYGEALLDKISPVTGRLHTRFKQMVSTGRMSSSDPNLQNIPGKQKYRSGFIAKEGCVLITADMSGAEVRILGNLSEEPAFKYCYDHGIDIHTKTASEIFKVSMVEAAASKYRKPAKAIGFGIIYGMSKYGLSNRLKISEAEAEKTINEYFKAYPKVYSYLTKSGKDAVRFGFSRSISGRKRFYDVPSVSSSDYKTVTRSIERQAKNAPIQGSNSDTIKKSMIYIVEELEKLDYYACLILTVHDEVIIETLFDKRYEVTKIVEDCIIRGFGFYFTHIGMETTGLISHCWTKEKCENPVDGKKCGGIEFEFRDKDLTCIKCDKINA